MDLLKNWAQILSVALICAAFADMLTSEGATKKGVKLCIAVFLCVSMLSPFIKNRETFNFDYDTAVQSSILHEREKYQAEIDEILVENTCEVLSQTLSEHIYYKIGVRATISFMDGHLSENRSFQADQINILIWSNDSTKKNLIETLVKNEVGDAAISFTEAET